MVRTDGTKTPRPPKRKTCLTRRKNQSDIPLFKEKKPTRRNETCEPNKPCRK
jgi:hypothetical protein